MTKTVRKPVPVSGAAKVASKPLATQALLTEKFCIQAHQDEVWDVCFSSDGTKLASSGADNSTIIYDVDNNFAILHLLEGHSAGIECAVWSPEDSKIVTCFQDNTARVWDTATGKCLHTLSGFLAPVTGCHWRPDGSSFATTSLDHTMNLCLWSLSDLPSLAYYNYPFDDPHIPILGCVLLPGTNSIASFDNVKNVYIHDLDSASRGHRSSSEMDLSSMSVSRIGNPYALFLRKHGLIEMVDVRTMDMVKVFKMKSYGHFVIKATFGGENEEFVVSGSEVYVWETETGALLMKKKVHIPPTSCNGVAWNPKRHGMLATAGDDHKVKILAINEEEES